MKYLQIYIFIGILLTTLILSLVALIYLIIQTQKTKSKRLNKENEIQLTLLNSNQEIQSNLGSHSSLYDTIGIKTSNDNLYDDIESLANINKSSNNAGSNITLYDTIGISSNNDIINRNSSLYDSVLSFEPTNTNTNSNIKQRKYESNESLYDTINLQKKSNLFLNNNSSFCDANNTTSSKGRRSNSFGNKDEQLTNSNSSLYDSLPPIKGSIHRSSNTPQIVQESYKSNENIYDTLPSREGNSSESCDLYDSVPSYKPVMKQNMIGNNKKHATGGIYKTNKDKQLTNSNSNLYDSLPLIKPTTYQSRQIEQECYESNKSIYDTLPTREDNNSANCDLYDSVPQYKPIMKQNMIGNNEWHPLPIIKRTESASSIQQMVVSNSSLYATIPNIKSESNIQLIHNNTSHTSNNQSFGNLNSNKEIDSTSNPINLSGSQNSIYDFIQPNNYNNEDLYDSILPQNIEEKIEYSDNVDRLYDTVIARTSNDDVDSEVGIEENEYDVILSNNNKELSVELIKNDSKKCVIQ